MNPSKLGPFLGMNNILEPHALTTEDGSFVQDALNVYFSNSGRVSRAAGLTSVTNLLAGAHSLWSDTGRTLCVDTGELRRIDNFTTFATTKLADLVHNGPMSYAGFNGELWYSNGLDSGRLSSTNEVSPWSMATPANPVLSAIAGTREPGRYHAAISYTNASGEESGCTPSVAIELAAPGGIRIALPVGAIGATHIKVYASYCNGDVLSRYTTVPVGTSYVEITAPTAFTGAAPSTQYLQPLPAGQLAFFNGRLLSWKGNTLYYSEPWNFGLYDPRKNYIQFEKDISVVAPNQHGVYIAADITRWFVGADIAAPETILDVLPCGAVPRSAFTHPDKPLVGWLSHKGVVLCDSQGQIQGVQDKALSQDYSTVSGAVCTVRQTEGVDYIWVSLS